MNNPWTDWLKVIQLKPRFLFGIWLFGLLFLNVPDKWAIQFGIDGLRVSIRPWVGVITLGGFVFWIVQLIPEVRRSRQARKRRNFLIEALDSISTAEWVVLAYCLKKNQRTIALNVVDPAICALVSKGMLVKAVGVNSMLSWPYTIPGSLWRHLLKIKVRFMNQSDMSPYQISIALQDLDQRVHQYDGVL